MLTGAFEERERLAQASPEQRLRLMLQLNQMISSRISIRSEVGIERVSRYQFVPGDHRTNFLIGAQLTFL